MSEVLILVQDHETAIEPIRETKATTLSLLHDKIPMQSYHDKRGCALVTNLGDIDI